MKASRLVNVRATKTLGLPQCTQEREPSLHVDYVASKRSSVTMHDHRVTAAWHLKLNVFTETPKTTRGKRV